MVARRESAERRALRRRKAAIACVLVGLAALRRFRRPGCVVVASSPSESASMALKTPHL